MIDGIVDAVCRFGEKFAVLMEGEGSRDPRFDESRGEGHSVVRKGVGKRSTCMIMEFKTFVAEGAVQQFPLPNSIGGGVSGSIHVACNNWSHGQNPRFLLVKMVKSCFYFFYFFSCSVHFLDCRHIRCRCRSNPLLHTRSDSSDSHNRCKGVSSYRDRRSGIV